MKKILAVVLIGVLFFGCGKKSDEKPQDLSAKMVTDSSAIKAVPIENVNQKFNLQYKFQKGDSYQYRMTQNTIDNLTFKTDSVITQNLNQSIIYLFNLTVSNIDKDGVMEISITIPSIKLTADANGQSYFYQSGITKDTNEVKKYAQYEALINNPFSVRVGKNSGIIEVFRADRIVDKLLQLSKPPTQPTADEKNALRNNIVESLLKPLVNQIFRELPNSALAKDSTWTHEQPAAPLLIFKLQNTNLYKITGLEKYNNDTLAVIDAGLNSVVTGDTKYVERGATYNFKRPDASASGTIYFDITRGCIQKANLKTIIHISFTLEAPTPKGKQKGSKDESIKTTNVLELL